MMRGVAFVSMQLLMQCFASHRGRGVGLWIGRPLSVQITVFHGRKKERMNKQSIKHAPNYAFLSAMVIINTDVITLSTLATACIQIFVINSKCHEATATDQCHHV